MNQEAPQFTHEDRKAGIYKTVAVLLIIITVLIGIQDSVSWNKLYSKER